MKLATKSFDAARSYNAIPTLQLGEKDPENEFRMTLVIAG